MTITQYTPSIAAAAAPDETSSKKDSAKIQSATKQFEALLISGMLRSAREAGGGGLGGDDQASSALMEMAEQQFSQLLAAGGGLGLSKLVTQGLSSPDNSASTHAEVPDSFKSSAIRNAYSEGI